MKDKELIEFLGGPSAIRKRIEREIGHTMTVQAVAHWKQRGIPAAWRLTLNAFAKRKRRAEKRAEND